MKVSKKIGGLTIFDQDLMLSPTVVDDGYKDSNAWQIEIYNSIREYINIINRNLSRVETYE